MMENQSYSKFPLGGVILIGLGVLFLLNNLGLLDFHEMLFDYWPVILIVIGVYIILKNNRKPEEHHTSMGVTEIVVNENQVREDKTFGNIRVKIDSNPFEGGFVKTVFGEVDVEIPPLKLETGTQKFEIATTFGEIRVQLAGDIPVKIVASNLGGTIQLLDKHREGLNQNLVYQSESYDNAPARLDIFCSVTFGEIRVW